MIDEGEGLGWGWLFGDQVDAGVAFQGEQVVVGAVVHFVHLVVHAVEAGQTLGQSLDVCEHCVG